MVIIRNNKPGEPSVFLHPFEREKILTGQKTTISFHKKISWSSEPGNSHLPESLLRSAINEISELIY
jgi:hypothetical protein